MKKMNLFLGMCCIVISIVLIAVLVVQKLSQSIPMLWLPIVLFLSLGITSLLWPKYAKVDGIDEGSSGLLADVLSRTKAINTTVVMGSIAVLLFILGLMFLRWDNSGERTVLRTAVFGFLVISSLGIGLHSLRRAIHLKDVDKSPFRQVLTREPEKIAWVYEKQRMVDTHLPRDQDYPSALEIWLDDGHMIEIDLLPDEKQRLINLIKQEAPNVHIGYHPELAQRFLPQDFEQSTTA
jgi:multisubunit Na+/H+ antiporter MnhG subunit